MSSFSPPKVVDCLDDRSQPSSVQACRSRRHPQDLLDSPSYQLGQSLQKDSSSFQYTNPSYKHIGGQSVTNVTASTNYEQYQQQTDYLEESSGDGASGTGYHIESAGSTELVFCPSAAPRNVSYHVSSAGTYLCPFCGKEFRLKGDFTRHCMIHTGEKPFTCPNCAFKTTRKSTLKKHIERTHFRFNESNL